MTPMQWRIWLLASAGKFFEGLVVFMTGVALPLFAHQFSLSPVEKGAVSSSVLFGILIGASLLGGMADRFGRKRMFIIEMIIFVVCLTSLIVSQGSVWLVVSLFGIGAALGCDYPTAHMIISESIPSSYRGRLVLSAFAFQAVGALAGTAIGYLILSEDRSLEAWRWMYATAIIPAMLVVVGRFFIPRSGHWLVSQGRIEEAEHETMRLLQRVPAYPTKIVLTACSRQDQKCETSAACQQSIFTPSIRRAGVLAAIPWFLQDLGTYGIGMFTPTILAHVIGASPGTVRNLADIIHRDMMATKGAAFLDLLLLFGVVAAIFLVDKVGRIRLQVLGFIGCAVGLVLAALSLEALGGSKSILLFSGFMLFNFMTNLGPNSMTYLIAGEVFPTHVRGKCSGLAASFAKIGAVLTTFLFPVLLSDIRPTVLLAGLAVSSIVGAVITWLFRIETNGVSLESFGEQ
ncbi:MAG: MFS transporter [Desulfovibrio sp.]|nr:MFS transporter [Desulfovibrio sp.]